MRLNTVATVVLLVSAMASEALAQRQITLLTTLANPGGSRVEAPEPASLRITENDVAATVLKVEPIDRVTKVQLLVDNGLGLGAPNLGELRNGVRGLIQALPEGTEVALVTTAPQPRFIERGTTDRGQLLKAVDLISPDSGAGRFVESLQEATDRLERDKSAPNAIIVSVATTAGDADVRERDIERIMKRLSTGRFQVHVVLLSVGAGRTSGGTAQIEVGMAAAKGTRGRYENIAVASRLGTLLPEIGAEMAKSLGPGVRQFRVTVERPAGMSGNLGRVTVGAEGLMVENVAIER